MVIKISGWILDPGTCAGMELGAPCVGVSALTDLHEPLIARGFRRSSSDHDVVEEKCDEGDSITIEAAHRASSTEELVAALEAVRGRGRNDYPVRAMWRALVAGVVFGHRSIASLLREFRRNPARLGACGFDPLPRQGAPCRVLDRGGGGSVHAWCSWPSRAAIRFPAIGTPRASCAKWSSTGVWSRR